METIFVLYQETTACVKLLLFCLMLDSVTIRAVFPQMSDDGLDIDLVH